MQGRIFEHQLFPLINGSSHKLLKIFKRRIEIYCWLEIAAKPVLTKDKLDLEIRLEAYLSCQPSSSFLVKQFRASLVIQALKTACVDKVLPRFLIDSQGGQELS